MHCGDSRAYLLRDRGLKQLSFDHTELARMVAAGVISKHEAISYPRKNVLTSALGAHKALEIQTFSSDTKPNDRLLLLTDGLYSEMSKQELQKTSTKEPHFERFCHAIIHNIKQKNITDNFTMIAIQFESVDFLLEKN